MAAASKKQTRKPETSSQNIAPAGDFFLTPLISMQKQMNRLMEETFKNFSQMPVLWPTSFEKIMPKVDVWEDDDMFYLKTKIPGMDSNDIDVAINDGFMTITCGSENKQSGNGHTFYQTQNACRTVMIPQNADAGKADAEIDDSGALLITMPKKRGAVENGRHIPVKHTA